ncbi:MAG TPA: hypothetical protein ENN80_13670, partial [Candidatus Hydrogenedentes bacterium]|nr:hypothetical protein [Candidatus Hydrogenedentota bacterium]
AYTVKNISQVPIADLSFSFAANIDLGGPRHAERQHAEVDKDRKAVFFQDERVDAVVALTGDADSYIVSTWPRAHQAMEQGDLLSFNAAERDNRARPCPRGMAIDLPAGSYAVGARADTPWQARHIAPEADLIRTEVARVVPKGETVDVILALAWHFPRWTSGDGENLRHRYAIAYDHAADVLATALEKAREAEAKIIAWQERVYAADVPPLLKDAVLNGLYILPRNSWWLDDGRFFQSESFTGCPITETFVCRFNGSFPLALLWPECERATMTAVANAQADTGEIPFGFGSPDHSRSPYYHVQHPIVSSEFALTVWRNYTLWRDEARLAEMYPAVKRALHFAMTLDKDNDGLVNEDPGSETGFPANQYYDIWPWWGVSAYTGSIWLAALRAGESYAQAMHDDAFADELRQWSARASAAFEDKLWTGSYYRLYNDRANDRRSDTSLTNALCGQWFAYTCGLGTIVPEDHIHSTIDTVLRLNAPATPYGAVNGVQPDGSLDTTFPDHSAVITIGEVWNFCAMAAFAGRAQDAIDLFNQSYRNLLLRQRTPWNLSWSLDPATGALKWGVHYYSNPCVWTLLQALDAETYRSLAERSSAPAPLTVNATR